MAETKCPDVDIAAPAPVADLPAEMRATGETLLARIKELAPQCPPIYLESLVGAYGQLVYITRGER